MDIHLSYKEMGEGEPLILLHGNGEKSSYFFVQISYFSQKRRVIAIDTRGHGDSPRGEAPFTIRQFAEDLKNFMDEHEIESADILGFSDGGNTAIIFALKYPERVRRLILNGANLDPGGIKPWMQIPITISYKLGMKFGGKSEKSKKNLELLGLMVNDPNIDPEELTKIKAKTLVIAGTKDMIKKSHSELIFDKIPDAQLAFIMGDHFIAKRNPVEYNAIIEEFLDS